MGPGHNRQRPGTGERGSDRRKAFQSILYFVFLASVINANIVWRFSYCNNLPFVWHIPFVYRLKEIRLLVGIQQGTVTVTLREASSTLRRRPFQNSGANS